MARKITASVLDKLKSWEGLRLAAYPDSGGVWTIGYGHTGKDVYKGRKITTAESEDLLLADLTRFERAVDEAVTVPLTDNQFGALVSFAFNVGEAAFAGSTLVKLLNGGDYNSVPAQLARWVHAGGRRVQGLVNRRAAEAGLWAAGAFVSSAPVAASVPPQGLLTAESATATAGVLSAVATAASTPGPLQWLFMAILVASYGFSALSWWSRRREQAR